MNTHWESWTITNNHEWSWLIWGSLLTTVILTPGACGREGLSSSSWHRFRFKVVNPLNPLRVLKWALAYTKHYFCNKFHVSSGHRPWESLGRRWGSFGRALGGAGVQFFHQSGPYESYGGLPTTIRRRISIRIFLDGSKVWLKQLLHQESRKPCIWEKVVFSKMVSLSSRTPEGKTCGV